MSVTAERPRDRFVSSYTELSVAVRASGLMSRRRGFYWSRIIGTVAAFVAVWVGAFLLGDSWWQLALAVALAVVSTQFGFLGHDGAHRQMFDSAKWNEWTARILSGTFAGLSLHWWQGKHSKHHNAPNQIGKDPDIGNGPIAFVPEYVAQRTGFYGAFTRRQGWLFFPLLTLEGAALHVASVRTLIGSKEIKHRKLELSLIALRLTIGFALPFLAMPAGLAVGFILVHFAVFGVLLGGSFAPNHKGMPLVPANAKIDFLRRQVLMSRNVDGGPVTDFMMGGLNYQIEHHLFPSMPRPNLKKVRPMVREHCAKHGVTYTETSLVKSYGIVVRYLNQVGLSKRNPFDCPLVREYRA
ncbi:MULTISPECIES: fatty acid desaturase family protein [unclassified Rhodococcus (in: high G+C Gram-positive bacteria)]|uniref:fatty acid desaturase family protein n=1 Tax=unclassified Rhodococcus (in: high G+C Gram-positive bacteria) TaxID=192944 RepID=UPI000485EB2A|nr:fatty acid desaturase [Rhodococcus sp. SORGH_AS_0303]